MFLKRSIRALFYVVTEEFQNLMHWTKQYEIYEKIQIKKPVPVHVILNV